MSAARRRTSSIALAVVGGVLAVAGGAALYGREEIFQPDAFADHAVQTLEQDEVREALTEPIVDQAVDSGPDELINAQPLLHSVVSATLASPPFEELFRRSARKTHKALFEKDPEQIALTIRDADVVVADAAESVSPQIGRRIPRDLGDRLLTITDSQIAITAARVSHDVRILGIVLPLLAVLCLAGSVLVHPDRRLGLLFASASVAVASAVALATLLIGRSLLLAKFEDETVRTAVAAAWEAFLGGLETWMLFGGAVAVIVAAAAATAREIDAAAPARRLAALVARAPETTWGRLGRAAAIAALSLLLVLRPELVLHIVTVAVGAYGLFYAFCEALALLAPVPRERRRRRLKRPPLRVAIASTALVGVVVVSALALALGGDGDGEVERPAGPVEACNGYAELCNRTLEDVVFPSSHNSMSAARLPGWFAPNHRYDIRRQLDEGIRAFLIDTHYGIKRSTGPVLTDLGREDRSKVLEGVRAELGPEGAKRFQNLAVRFARRGGEGKPGSYLCHVVCELGSIDLVKALGWFRDFLETHPDEFLILFIEDQVSPKDTEKAFEKSGILRFAYVHERSEPFPTLRELIESDRRLFVMAEMDNGAGSIPWYHSGFDLTQETPFTFRTPAELADAAGCAPNRGQPASPLFQLNHWIEKVPRSPKTARQVNEFGFLKARARLCERRRGLLPNLIPVDHYDQGEVFEVARVLNGLARDAEPSYRETR